MSRLQRQIATKVGTQKEKELADVEVNFQRLTFFSFFRKRLQNFEQFFRLTFCLCECKRDFVRSRNSSTDNKHRDGREMCCRRLINL